MTVVIADDSLPVFTKALTTDRSDPDLRKLKPNGQYATYLILSAEERAKGFVRPYRDAYMHVGVKPRYELRELTDEERERYSNMNYIRFEVYPQSEFPKTGRFWSAAELDFACGAVTKMGREIAETYARNPKFYGATFCIRCRKHSPVDEFVWLDSDERVGS